MYKETIHTVHVKRDEWQMLSGKLNKPMETWLVVPFPRASSSPNVRRTAEGKAPASKSRDYVSSSHKYLFSAEGKSSVQ